MPGGGSRPGERRGGRQKGTRNRKTVELQQKAKALGIEPLDVMLFAMRDHWQAAEEANDPETRLSLMRQAHDLATSAAPYVHPKLAAIQHSGQDNKPMQHQFELTPAAQAILDRAMAGLRRRG